jgi:hypothetical protein
MDLFFCEKLQKKCVKRPVRLPLYLESWTEQRRGLGYRCPPQARVRSVSLSPHEATTTRMRSRNHGLPREAATCVRSLSLSSATHPLSLGLRRLHRPTPGGEAFVGLFTGDEHSPGILTPSTPFLLCETEHPNPNLKAIWQFDC